MFLVPLHEVLSFKSKDLDFELMHSDAFSYYPIEGRITPFCGLNVMFRMAHYHTTLTISAVFSMYCTQCAYYVKFVYAYGI